MVRSGRCLFGLVLLCALAHAIVVKGWKHQIQSLTALDVVNRKGNAVSKKKGSVADIASSRSSSSDEGTPTKVTRNYEVVLAGLQAYLRNHRSILWVVPVLGCVLSFHTFTSTSQFFHNTVQWASDNTWIPERLEDVNLQANVVTQVVNGPVITSISLLFAALVSITISNLFARQSDIQKSFVMEVQALRLLHHAVASSSTCFSEPQRRELLKCIRNHSERLIRESSPQNEESKELNPDLYIQADLLQLLNVATPENEFPLHFQEDSYLYQQYKDLTSQIQQRVDSILIQRSNRWLALRSLHFPVVHYLTLGLLAIGIAVSFLVATDEAEFIFLRGLPVRILWTVLCTSFCALATLCVDLSRPFGGAYRVQQ